MTRASNWDEIICVANVMVRLLFSAFLCMLVLVCNVLMVRKKEMECSRVVATREASEVLQGSQRMVLLWLCALRDKELCCNNTLK